MLAASLGKIIIVDEDDNISKLLQINLTSEGYEIVIYDTRVRDKRSPKKVESAA